MHECLSERFKALSFCLFFLFSHFIVEDRVSILVWTSTTVYALFHFNLILSTAAQVASNHNSVHSQRDRQRTHFASFYHIAKRNQQRIIDTAEMHSFSPF